jgi:Cu(I)/Ag(I) efflux system membrane fusion protein
VKAPLERVRRGQALAEIIAPQWREAEQEYLALLDSGAESTKGLRDASRQRLIVLGVPEATIRAIETTRKTPVASTVFSPIDGVVSDLGVRQGAAFSSGSTLFQLNGLSTVWVNAQIPEAMSRSSRSGRPLKRMRPAGPACIQRTGHRAHAG